MLVSLQLLLHPFTQEQTFGRTILAFGFIAQQLHLHRANSPLSSGLTALSLWLMALIVVVCAVLASYMLILYTGEPKEPEGLAKEPGAGGQETRGLGWNRMLCWVNSAIFTLFVVVYTIIIACFTN